MKIISKILVPILMIVSFSAQAESGDVGLVFELGLHAGGDEVTRASTTTGEETVTAGGGISAAIGAGFDITDDMSMQLTFGFKDDSINGSNGNISFSRDTLDLLFHSKLTDSVSLGAGVTAHTNVKLTSDGVGAFYVQDTDFENAYGALLDAKFDVGDPGKFFLALRLTFIEYETTQNNLAKKTFSGNSLGLIWGGRF